MPEGGFINLTRGSPIIVKLYKYIEMIWGRISNDLRCSLVHYLLV